MADRTDALEWPMNLDVGALLRDGWHPTPFRQFIVKIHSRCNLACDYCYVYEMADQSWRDRPRRMTPATIALIASRIAEHVRAHRIPEVDLIFHGGEPLLAGIELIRHAVTTVRSAIGPEASVNVRVQSNGLLLDSAFLRAFDELGVRVGISLDGDARGNDRHRRHADGRGSHDEVRAALERLTAGRYRHLFGGLLATVDLRNDPVATYEALLEFAPAEVDFLLPHGNWNSPPPGLSPGEHATPYGDWLIAAFDRWYGAPVRETRVRLFGEIIRLLLGGASRIESVGLSPVAMVVLETDGSIEQVDTLKSVYEGASATGLHVSRDSFDAVLRLPSVAARQIGDRALSAQCRGCAIRRVCGGGLYTHRYRAGSGFANPSVYCADLVRLITHVHQVIAGDLREGTA